MHCVNRNLPTYRGRPLIKLRARKSAIVIMRRLRSVIVARLLLHASALTVAGLRRELLQLRDAIAVDSSGDVARAAAARGVASSEIVRESVMASRYALDLDACEVGSGGVAGRGCFAARDVAAGELLTIYPGDALCRGDAAVRTRGVTFASHVPEALRDAEALTGAWVDYEVAPYRGSTTIVGIPDLAGERAYLGHYCNDGATLGAGGDAGAYAAASAAAANACFESLADMHCAVVATRRIAAGEEVLVTYGAAYWRTRPAEGAGT